MQRALPASTWTARRTAIAIARPSKGQECAGCTGRRAFSASSSAHAKLLAHRMAKEGDPMDMINLEEFAHDDVPMATHWRMERDREKLHILRLIEFQLPQIRKSLPRKLTPPPASNFIEVRTIHHPGNPSHPASRKAVLTVRLQDLISAQGILSAAPEQHKFKLLAGPRWDPDRGTVKISCDMFPTANMNSKWCSDALDRLIAEAQDQSDPMTDIKLSLRHAEVRKEKKGKRRATIADFPKEWLPTGSK